MKLGGLTWWRYNYGSILQAYALQEKLNSYPEVDYEIVCQYGKKVTSGSNLIDKLRRYGLIVTIKKIIWKFGLKKLRSRNNKIQAFMDNYLKVSDKEYKEENMEIANDYYDGFVCGSDQIWNPELVGTNSIYWLNFAHENKIKIAYAPSVGVNKVTKDQASEIRANLKNFKAISSREENGTKLINDILKENKCSTVLDPTMLVSRKIWDNVSADKLYQEKYIFVYMLRGTKEQRKFIEKFAKKKNLKIVTMPFLDAERIEPYDFWFGDIKLWDADPSEFISAIRYAQYVFTDSFHSMVFSCLYHRDFFVFPKIGKAQLNRLTTLQEMLEIKGRMINKDTTIGQLEEVSEIDWEKVDNILQRKRKISEEFLDNALRK